MNGNNQNKYRKGFTLVELLIAGVVFSIVFGSAMGILVWSMKWQKYNMSHQQLLNQSSYTIEYMARAIRMAQKDDDGDCINAGKNYFVSDEGRKIEFKRSDGDCGSFYWDTVANQIKVTKLGSFMDEPLTSGDYEVTKLEFVVAGDGDPDKQPRVTILMEIQDKNLPDKPKVKVQTTVSQRNLDL